MKVTEATSPQSRFDLRGRLSSARSNNVLSMTINLRVGDNGAVPKTFSFVSQAPELDHTKQHVGARSEVKLEGVDSNKVEEAKLIASKIKEKWELANSLNKEYKAARKRYSNAVKEARRQRKIHMTFTQHSHPSAIAANEKRKDFELEAKGHLAEARSIRDVIDKYMIKPNSTSTTQEFFKQIIAQNVKELRGEGASINIGAETDDELHTLTAYYCLKSRTNPGGFFQRLPSGIFDYDSGQFDNRIRTFLRHYLVDIRKRDTARKIETTKCWARLLQRGGLGFLLTTFEKPSINTMLKITFPGYLDGEDPVIREWILPGGDKWQGDHGYELAARACAWLLKHGAGWINQDGTVNAQVVSKVRNPGNYFHANTTAGLSGMMDTCPYTRTTEDAINLGVQQLGCAPLIGTGEGQIPRWRIKRDGMWQGEAGERLTNELAEYLVEKKLKCVDENGNVSAKKIKEVTDWAIQFRDEANHSLGKRVARKTAYVAIKGRYPELCGFRKDQVKPWEIRFGGMWRGAKGRKLFRLAFAYSLWDSGLGTFNENGEPPLTFTKQELIEWKDKHLINWRDHFLKCHLTAGFRDVAGSNTRRAFEVLLGDIRVKQKQKMGVKVEERYFGRTRITPDDIKDSKPTRAALVSRLLEASEDYDLGQVIFIADKDRQEDPHNEQLPEAIVNGTCLEEVLAHKPPTKVLLARQVLYEALIGSIAASAERNELSNSVDRFTGLEQLLVAKYALSTELAGEFVLSNDRLRSLLRFVRDDVLPEINIKDEVREQLEEMLGELLDGHCETRETLLSAYDALNAANITRNEKAKNTEEVEYDQGTNLLSVLNSVIECVFRKILLFELRYIHNGTHGGVFGSPTSYFCEVFDKIAVPEEDLDLSCTLEMQPGQDQSEDEVAIRVADMDADAKTLIDIARRGAESEDSKALLEGAVEAAKEEAALLGQTEDDIRVASEKEALLNETRLICTGDKKEDPRIVQNLVDVAKDITKGQIHLMDFLRIIDEGDLTAQIRILHQIGDRMSSRAHDRFDYGSLRVRALPAPRIGIICGGDIVDSGNYTVPDLDLVDKELFECIPEWWPVNNGEPTCVPLLFSNDVLYVAVPYCSDSGSMLKFAKGVCEYGQRNGIVDKSFFEPVAQSLDQSIKGGTAVDRSLNQPLQEVLQKMLSAQLAESTIELRDVRYDSWLDLVRLYEQYARVRIVHPERKPFRQFISYAEENAIVENVAALRKAASQYVYKRHH